MIKINKSIDLSNLPKRIYRGKDGINWNECIGLYIPFEYWR